MYYIIFFLWAECSRPGEGESAVMHAYSGFIAYINPFTIGAYLLGAVNRMGVDALENYIELILSNEKYTSHDTEFLKEVWGEETYYRFYAKETDSQ